MFTRQEVFSGQEVLTGQEAVLTGQEVFSGQEVLTGQEAVLTGQEVQFLDRKWLWNKSTCKSLLVHCANFTACVCC